MRQYLVSGLAAGLMTGALIVAAPPASAGCQPYGLGQLCDGPLEPDGTWQRCEVAHNVWDEQRTTSTCYPLGDNHWLPPFQPPGHIDP